MRRSIVVMAAVIALTAVPLAARVGAATGHTVHLPILLVAGGGPPPATDMPSEAPTASATPLPSATPSASPTRPAPPTATPPGEASEVALDRVVDLINAERATHGLPAVARNDLLDEAARQHSEDMASHDLFDHTGSDGSTADERLDRVGYVWSSCGEIIAAGYPSPDGAVDGWMHSPGHRAIILTPGFTEIGVGYAYGGDSAYGHYWTADLAAPASAPVAAHAR